MDDELDYRPWDELMPDALGLIFSRLPLDEILNVVPSVCKSWAKAVRGPYCWQEIDIEDWSRYRRPESLDRMLLLLIGRSCGSLRKLSVFGLATEISLSLIADHAKFLQSLRLPRSEISNLMVEQFAPRFLSLNSLDLSYCTKIGAPALEAFGKHCRVLTCLQRNMHPWDIIDRTSQDDEAFAIAATMPQLKRLELAYLRITTEAVLRIVANCSELEVLDIRGCWNVKLEDKFLKNHSELKVVGPLVVDSCGNMNEHFDFYHFYHGSSSFFSLDFLVMDAYDDDEIPDDVWDEMHEMEDLGLMSYDYDDLDMYG